MLKKVNEGKVESDEGFFIHIIELECMRYQEDGMYIDFTWAYDPTSKKTLIYVNHITNWDQPFGKPISENDRIKIISNIQKAVKLLTGDFEVV